jgi:hypothetical protein
VRGAPDHEMTGGRTPIRALQGPEKAGLRAELRKMAAYSRIEMATRMASVPGGGANVLAKKIKEEGWRRRPEKTPEPWVRVVGRFDSEDSD